LRRNNLDVIAEANVLEFAEEGIAMGGEADVSGLSGTGSAGDPAGTLG
jgi:hypothetical protein